MIVVAMLGDRDPRTAPPPRGGPSNRSKLAGADGTALNGVACATATTCTAVGVVIGPARTRPSPRDGMAPGGLSSPHRSFGIDWRPAQWGRVYRCHRVRRRRRSRRHIWHSDARERWDGKAWTVQPTPNPLGALRSEFNAWPVRQATRCVAVGWYSRDGFKKNRQPGGAVGWDEVDDLAHSKSARRDSDRPEWGRLPVSEIMYRRWGEQRLRQSQARHTGERWNGTKWSIEPTPNPSGRTPASSTRSDCRAARLCTTLRPASDCQRTRATQAFATRRRPPSAPLDGVPVYRGRLNGPFRPVPRSANAPSAPGLPDGRCKALLPAIDRVEEAGSSAPRGGLGSIDPLCPFHLPPV